eukprot:15437433-Alexandrium_andersonii.AAC.1
MVSRSVVLAFMGLGKRCEWMIEQPAGSLLEKHTRMEGLKETARALPSYTDFVKTHTWMGCFRSWSAKGTVLYGSGEWVCDLRRNMTKAPRQTLDSSGVYKKYTDATGRSRTSGGPLLKATQAYTPQFAAAVFRACTDFREKQFGITEDLDAVETSSCDSLASTVIDDLDEDWSDLELDDVLVMCKKPRVRGFD